MRLRAPALLTILAGVALFGAGIAAADPPSAALRSYAAGNYMAAADLAEQRRSPESLAFAARALMAECVVSRDETRIIALSERAEAAARAALTLDSEAVEARLQYAIALGVRGRHASLTEAWRRGYARRGKDLIDEAIAIDPNNAWGHALLGGWNLEVIRRGGRAGAVAYGARESAGIAAFERARALAPDDPMIALHYAIALLELDSERHGVRAGELLAAATALPARDAFEARALANARRVARVLEADGADAAADLARELFI
jgi:hypothetical protein